MDENRWSDRQLREFIRRISSHAWWCETPDTERDAEHERFRREVRARIVPTVQSRLLQKVGTLTDPEGISMVADELIDDGCRDDERRWLMVSPEPWDYLAAWVASDLAKAYKGASGARPTDSKALRRLEKDVKAEK